MDKNNRISLFCIVTSLYWFSLYTYVPTLSIYAQSLGATYKMVGLIIGSYGFTQMLLRIPLGIISDTISKRKIFVISGIALALISSLGMWYFRSPGTLLVFRSMSGAAAAAWVTFTVLFSSYFEGHQSPKAIGYITAVTTLGQVAAVFLGGIAAERFGRQSPFLLALFGAVAGILLSLGIKEKEDLNREPLKPKELLAVAKDSNLLLLSILAVFIQFLSFATVYGFTPVAAKNIGATPFQLGLLTTLSTLPRVFAAALSGSFFVSIIGERKTLVYGFLLASGACIVIPFVNSMYILYITQIIGGFSQGTVFPLLMGLTIKNVQDCKRATAMGFFQAIYGAGMFLGPVVVGILSDTVGLAWGFIVTGMIGTAGAVLTAVFVNQARYNGNPKTM